MLFNLYIWQEMLLFLLKKDQDPGSLQEHWRPIYHLCHPCTITYDYIGDFANLKHDSELILNQILPKRNFSFPEVSKSKTPLLLKQQLERLDPKLVEAVRLLFAADIDMFGRWSI